MKLSARYLLGTFFLFFPVLAIAQHLGQIACARPEGYTYLYSSMTTMDVVRTLQCGEQVEVTGRYEAFFSVRTANGETGYVGAGSLVLLKDNPGAKATLPASPQTARPRTAYDEPAPAPPPAHPIPAGFDFMLPSSTPMHLKFSKTISSETAHVGDVVDLVVAEDVVFDGLCVIPSGASAEGVVTEAEPRKRGRKDGKLSLNVKSVHLADNEKAPARSFEVSAGSNSAGGSILPLTRGKEAVFTQGTEITAYVDGSVYLKRASFPPAKNARNPVAKGAPDLAQPHER